MWLVRLLIGVARPIARGRKRRRVGPSSTVIEETRISSPTRSWLFSALAAAELISLWMSWAAPRGENCRSARAFSMCMPRTWSAISRALRGAIRTYRALALTTGGAAGFLAAGFFAGAFEAFFSLPLAVLDSLPFASFFALAFFDSFLAAGFFDSFFAAGFLPAFAAFASSFFAAFFASAFSPEAFAASAFFVVGFFSSAIASPYRRASGRSGSARTRRACARPSTPR